MILGYPPAESGHNQTPLLSLIGAMRVISTATNNRRGGRISKIDAVLSLKSAMIRATSTLKAILRRVIDLIQVNAGGKELGPVLETTETALRADPKAD
jgi:hypothetical protein